MEQSKSNDAPAILELCNVSKIYHSREVVQKEVLKGVSLKVRKGEFVALMGASGAGKTTILNLISGLDKCDDGSILMNGSDIAKMTEEKRSKMRRTLLGMVFQDFHLLDELTLKENIALPMTLEKSDEDNIEKEINQLADFFGIATDLEHYPYEVSGGEQQRAAISRALVNHPVLLLADEPTGNLDLKAAKNILGHFEKIHSETSILMVTHDIYAASYCDRILYLEDGQIEREVSKNGRSRKDFLAWMQEGGLQYDL